MTETVIYRWIDEPMQISRETRFDGKVLTMGYRINGGEFTPTVTITTQEANRMPGWVDWLVQKVRAAEQRLLS